MPRLQALTGRSFLDTELKRAGIDATVSPLTVPPSVYVKVNTKITSSREAELSSAELNDIATNAGGIHGSVTVETNEQGVSEGQANVATFCNIMIAGLLVVLKVF